MSVDVLKLTGISRSKGTPRNMGLFCFGLMCGIASEEKECWLNEPQQPNCLRNYIIRMVVEMKFGFTRYFQIFDAVITLIVREDLHNL